MVPASPRYLRLHRRDELHAVMQRETMSRPHGYPRVGEGQVRASMIDVVDAKEAVDLYRLNLAVVQDFYQMPADLGKEIGHNL